MLLLYNNNSSVLYCQISARYFESLRLCEKNVLNHLGGHKGLTTLSLATEILWSRRKAEGKDREIPKKLWVDIVRANLRCTSPEWVQIPEIRSGSWDWIATTHNIIYIY